MSSTLPGQVIPHILQAIAADADSADAYRERLELISHKLKFIEDKPSVMVVRDLRSLLPADGLMIDLVTLAGGKPEIEITDNPDALVIAPAGSSIAKTLGTMHILTEMEGWSELKAVKNGRVYIANGEHYFRQSGTAVADTAEILAEIVHPKQFVFGFEGKGWVRFA